MERGTATECSHKWRVSMGRKKTVEVAVDTPMEPLPRLAFEVPEACEVLRIGRPNLLGLIESGRLRVVRIGNRVIIPRVAIDDFLAHDNFSKESKIA